MFVPVTVTVFVNCPACVARTTTVTVAEAFAASVPRLQLIVAPPVHVPCVVETDRNAIGPGSGSTSSTFVAVLGPLFVTTSV